ncbi:MULTISPECIES: ROK family protein [Streptosporangium]|uniref:ROK family protein n=1 Tax=Streptosporangium TaxID=2000 RepID=UPI0027D80B9E|nr:ROK family protein [Streptosporangium brasiliense]
MPCCVSCPRSIWSNRLTGDRPVALIGSGVGAGIITDGIPCRGVNSSAGEWGHTKITMGGRPCRCGGRGLISARPG